MNCRRAKRLLPLAAGGDLPPRKFGRLEAHLKKCSGCRAELQAYRTALLGMKSLAGGEPQAGWPESEWRAALQLATSPGPVKAKPALGPFPKRLAWTMGSALVLALVAGSILIFRPARNRESLRLPAPAIVEKSASQAQTLRPGPAPLPSPELKESTARPKAGPRLPLGAEKISAGRPAEIQAYKKQEVMNMAFVSPDSGLTIHWVFNSEFEWKEK